MEKFVVANGCALRIADTEKGDAVVLLLHGYLEALDVFDEFTWQLADRVRVVSLDLPGHGISEVKGEVHGMEFLADTAVAVLDHLGVDRAVVVGHSMGGYVALEILNRHPERVAGLVMLHSRPDADTEEKRADRLREIALIESGKKDLLTKTVPQRLFASQNVRRFRDVQEEMAEQIYLTDDEGITALLRGMGDRKDHNELLRSSQIPQMFVFGRHDEIIPEERARMTEEAHPQAQTVWFEESGHVAFIEEQERCSEVVTEFAFRAFGLPAEEA
ncbi:MAG: alpha/beta hydrolase [Tidjanibacter sp.]|nr:alpha/beta hydrolase [Tidjanibacter sp.]